LTVDLFFQIGILALEVVYFDNFFILKPFLISILTFQAFVFFIRFIFFILLCTMSENKEIFLVQNAMIAAFLNDEIDATYTNGSIDGNVKNLLSQIYSKRNSYFLVDFIFMIPYFALIINGFLKKRIILYLYISCSFCF